ncbi:MAG: DUF2442 domain-containing protein [Pseudomonadales bacterium]|nr:DUF2442 domain-containing protein [Pseudomonadales bacterium]
MLHIKSIRYLKDFKLWVSFDDGTEGTIDFDGKLHGSIFEPLSDRHFFSRASVDPELETIVWPNGADLAPEFIKALHTSQHKKDSFGQA